VSSLPPSPPPSGGLTAGGAEYPAGPPEQWPAWSPLPAPPGPGDPWAAPAPGPGPSGKGPALVVIGVVIALVLVVVAGVILTNDDPDDLASGSTTTIDLDDPPPSTSPLPTMPTMPSIPDLGPDTDPEALARPLEEVLPELIAFVETQRGHRFTTAPVVQAVPEDEFLAALEATTDEAEIAQLRRDSVAEQALGLITPGTDLAEISRELAAAGVVGFYEPETAELLVRGDSITPFVQTVIVHELTHALDDQTFDLQRLDAMVEQPDETAVGFVTLVEGTAKWVETAFREQLSPEELAAVEAEELQFGLEQGPDLLDIPLPFLIESQVPYTVGLQMVTALTEVGGVASLDAAFADPPVTSEQVLDPDAYEAREPSVAVPAPEADGPVVDEGDFGALDLFLLGVAADPMSAGPALASGLIEAPEGFGGGSYVSWGSAAQACVRVTLAGEGESGAAAIDEITSSWRSAFGGAQVGTAPGPGGTTLITLFRCA